MSGAQTDINQHLLGEISSINGRLGSIEGDIKLIKSCVERGEQSTERKHSYLRDVTLLGIAAGIAAVVSFVTGYRA